MVEVPLLLHERHHGMLGPRGVEEILLGIGCIETTLPNTFEVYRVGQHQIGVVPDATRWKKVPDVSFRHIADPFVNTPKNRRRIGTEIGLLQLIAE